MHGGCNDAEIAAIGAFCEEQPRKKALVGFPCHVCTYLNKATALMCEVCSTERLREGSSTGWQCGACTAENEHSAVRCGVCGCEKDGMQDTIGFEEEDIAEICAYEDACDASGVWRCEMCSFDNVGAKEHGCEMCGVGANKHQEEAKAAKPKPGADGNGKHEEETAAVFDSATSTSGLIELLRAKMEPTVSTAVGTKRRQREAPEAFLCSPLLHISQRGFEGAHWSCGFRNIQMLCSSLIQRPEYRAVMFNGSNEIPDVCGIQAWIEKAWADGFDAMGCLQLGGTLLGTRKWIGATECACLLRFMGVRAMVVDFSHSPVHSTQSDGKEAEGQASAGWPIRDNGSKKRKQQPAEKPKHELIVDWCRRYFSTEWGTTMDFLGGNPSARGMEEYLPPLYFQHNGHSRTIVGFETAKDKTNLFVFDPSQRGDTIKRHLTDGSGWQRFLKRGLHTLRKNQYQIVYIKPGIMSAQEREQSKIIGAEF